MKLHTKLRRSVKIAATVRVQQVLGMFDVPPAAESSQEWPVTLDLPAEWSIGAIVGRSGDGKTTVARWLAERLGTRVIGARNPDGTECPPWPWPADKSILDGFPAEMSVKDIVGLLSSVGFSSPPAWLRPFHVLSNGQQFRVNLARTLAERAPVAIVDEFSSVVDRKVAAIGSAAVAKAVRRMQKKFVAVTCHYDVLDWLEPDWVFEPATNTLTVSREPGSGRSLRRRPPIILRIAATPRETWARFREHHYLSHDLHRSARCFVGTIDGEAAAFTAVIHFPTAHGVTYREHRTVCLPDYQGVGIGNRMSEQVAAMFAATGRPYYSLTSHPGMIRHRQRSKLWRCTRPPAMTMRGHDGMQKSGGGERANSATRITASFRYVGEPDEHGAVRLGVISDRRVNP